MDSWRSDVLARAVLYPFFGELVDKSYPHDQDTARFSFFLTFFVFNLGAIGIILILGKTFLSVGLCLCA